MDTQIEPHLIVVGGGGEATYTLPRAYFEATGLKADVLTTSGAPSLLLGSRILNLRTGVELGDDEALLKAVEEIVESRQGPALLVATSNVLLDWLLMIRSDLPDQVILPYTSSENIGSGSDKAEFAALCKELGIPHPVTVTVDRDRCEVEGSAPAPGYLKPVDQVEWGTVSFDGKRKVYAFRSLSEAEGYLRSAREHGYRGRFVLQEEVPGNDEQMRVLTLYRDRSGKVTLAHGGKVGLHTHGASDEGVSEVILTGPQPELELQASRILDRLEWRGFASFDVKVHSDTGVAYFLELNPRTSATAHYMTASGVNPYLAWRNDWVLDRQGELIKPTRRVVYSSIPRKAIRQLTSERFLAEAKGVPIRHPLLSVRDMTPGKQSRWRTVRVLRTMRAKVQAHLS